MRIPTACRPGLLPLGGVLLLATCGLSAQSLQRVSLDTWPSTTYYLGFAEFASSAEGRIHITAGDRYTLYLNGDRVGADDDPATVGTYDVSFVRRTNTVAVVVEHEGGGTPYGLLCILQAQDVLLVSSPTDRTTPWFWTGFPLANEADAAWTKLKLNQLGRHEEDGLPVSWSPVQAGTLDPAAFPGLAGLDSAGAGSVAGFPGGLDGSRGRLQLRSLAGRNAAFGALSADPKLVDGDIRTSVSFRKGATALLQQVEIDLGRLITISRVRVLTEPPSQGEFADLSLRGYSILVSKDAVSFIEVGSRNGITTFAESQVDFPPIAARTVRLVVTEFSNRDASPRVGEMEVYGEGIDPEGTFLSRPLDLGTPEAKNFDRVQWFGEVPAAASLEFRFRSGDDGAAWSAWSTWSSDAEIPLGVPEPRRLLQFEARMRTRDLFVGPRLDSLVVFHAIGAMPASGALAAIAPLLVPIGVDTTFLYTLSLQIGRADAGVARLAILTPWPAELDVGGVQGTGASGIDAAGTYATNDTLVISFAPPLRGDAELRIPFITRLLSASHPFRGLLYTPDATVPLEVGERQGTDPLSGRPYSLRVETLDYAIPILTEVRAHPPVFSPNGDQVNDHTTVGFTLARVSGAPVRVQIYDLSGVLVRSLPERHLHAGRYAPAGSRPADLPGQWDGRDDRGEPVAPGLYLYRVRVDLDPQDVVRTGTVGVVH
ncbi:MAG: discoidin domain-containing protein [Candidatus Latescibacterota bacterium]